MKKEVFDLLIHKNYCVRIFQDHSTDNLFSVYLPKNQDLNIPEQYYQYYLLKNEWIITRLTDKKNYTLSVEDFEIKPLIMSDICIKTQKRKIDLELICTINKSGVQDRLYNLLPCSKNEKENFLTNFIDNYLTGVKNYDIIEQNKLQSSFDKFMLIYDNDGIL